MELSFIELPEKPQTVQPSSLFPSASDHPVGFPPDYARSSSNQEPAAFSEITKPYPEHSETAETKHSEYAENPETAKTERSEIAETADDSEDHSERLRRYLNSPELEPLLISQDALQILKLLPDACIDVIITSPPYFHKRQYASGGIGQESNPQEYLDALVHVFAQAYRILKPTGCLWLNLGDSYHQKHLQLLPYRLVIRLCDELGFVLRNQVVWNKRKGGPDSTKDRLRNLWEPVFFLTKRESGYYFNLDNARTTPIKPKCTDSGSVTTATGVNGSRYRSQIEHSLHLTSQEKAQALQALDDMLHQVKAGVIPDFRMVIRGTGRSIHGQSAEISARAKELEEKGYYFLCYSGKGAKLPDLWDIIPEDSHNRTAHYAPFPMELVMKPLAITCPLGGIVLDPFVGTGTTCKAAYEMGFKSIGIDLCPDYIEYAKARCTIQPIGFKSHEPEEKV